ncbi:HNH endonuclease [Ruminococcus sp. 5_1_39BFAA]|uniref:HNH endonuclease n=1 Tax=Ruminococcus sp. 5_1_39BFAA TaxID=457412 RepID=UPI0035681682
MGYNNLDSNDLEINAISPTDIECSDINDEDMSDFECEDVGIEDLDNLEVAENEIVDIDLDKSESVNDINLTDIECGDINNEDMSDFECEDVEIEDVDNLNAPENEIIDIDFDEAESLDEPGIEVRELLNESELDTSDNMEIGDMEYSELEDEIKHSVSEDEGGFLAEELNEYEDYGENKEIELADNLESLDADGIVENEIPWEQDATDAFDEEMKSFDLYEDLEKTDLTDEEKTQVIRDFVEQNVSPSVLPKTGGHWKDPDAVGDSQWVLHDDTEITWNKAGEKHTMTGLELKEKYGINGVDYRGNEPNFEDFEDEWIGHVEIDDFSDRRTGENGTYDVATRTAAQTLGCESKEIEKYMRENGLTWHECGDRRTIRAIPTEINAIFKHTGGIGIEKSVDAVGKTLYSKYGDFNVDRDGLKGTFSLAEMEKAVGNIRQEFKETKKSK